MLLYVHRDHKDYWGRGSMCDVVVEVLLYVHRNRGKQAYLGRGAQDGHLDFHTAPEL